MNIDTLGAFRLSKSRSQWNGSFPAAKTGVRARATDGHLSHVRNLVILAVANGLPDQHPSTFFIYHKRTCYLAAAPDIYTAPKKSMT